MTMSQNFAIIFLFCLIATLSNGKPSARTMKEFGHLLTSEEILKFHPKPEKPDGGIEIEELMTSTNDEVGEKRQKIKLQKRFDFNKTLSELTSFGFEEEKRVAIKEHIFNGEKSRYWPNGIVYYDFDSMLRANANDEQSVIYGALQEYQKKTCIKFEPYNAATMGLDGDRVKIVTDQGGCSSYEGRIGGEQPMTLEIGAYCINHRVVLHEFGHALGLNHEQNRQDRDNYLTIHFGNIEPDDLYNYKKAGDNYMQPITPYDYLSIMHYGPDFLALKDSSGNKLVAMEAKDKCYQALMGRARFLSYYDHKLINHIYKCDADCNSVTCGPNCYATRSGSNQNCHCVCLDNSNNNCKGGSCFAGDKYVDCRDLVRLNYEYECKGDYRDDCCQSCKDAEDDWTTEVCHSDFYSDCGVMAENNPSKTCRKNLKKCCKTCEKYPHIKPDKNCPEGNMYYNCQNWFEQDSQWTCSTYTKECCYTCKDFS